MGNEIAVGISVIICCYNSSKRLPDTIKHLASQKLAKDINWEVILIDNASTDDTAVIAQREWDSYGQLSPAFTVLKEPRPGKTFAFKTGVYAAKYEYLLTCDDDNWLYPDYIKQACDFMFANARAGVLGGCGFFEPEQPVNPEIVPYKHSYVNGAQSWAASDHWVYGAGSLCRKSILLELFSKGWQQITSGRTGGKLISGEDVEICLMIFLSGNEVLANDELKFKHFVPKERQNMRYILKLHYWQGYSYQLLTGYLLIKKNQQKGIKATLAKELTRNLKALILSTMKITKAKLSGGIISDNEKFALQSYLGAVHSILKNKTRIIEHCAHLEKLLPPGRN